MTEETEIVRRCVRYFAGKGYVVTREVPIGRKVADLYCVNRRTAECIAVEAKMRDWVQALAQARIYQLGADLVYIAMPEETARRANQALLIEEGVGLLSVSALGKVKQQVAARQSPVRRRSLVERAMSVVGGKVGEAGLSA